MKVGDEVGHLLEFAWEQFEDVYLVERRLIDKSGSFHIAILADIIKNTL